MACITGVAKGSQGAHAPIPPLSVSEKRTKRRALVYVTALHKLSLIMAFNVHENIVFI